jgi:hypothetical protein
MNYALDLAKYFILSCFRLKLRCVYPGIFAALLQQWDYGEAAGKENSTIK